MKKARERVRELVGSKRNQDEVYISSAEAALALKLEDRAARALLNRHSVSYVFVSIISDGLLHKFWAKSEVESVMRERESKVRHDEFADEVRVEEAAGILGVVSYPAVFTYARRHGIRRRKKRVIGDGRPRDVTVFCREDLLRCVEYRKERDLHKLELEKRRNRGVTND